MQSSVQPCPGGPLASGREPGDWRRRVSGACLAVLAMGVVMDITLRLAGRSAGWSGVDDLVWLLAAVTALAGMSRTLPIQNAVAAGVISGVIGFGAAWLSGLAGFPIGRRVFTGALNWQVAGVPVALAFIWITLIVLGQGVGRLVMRRWRRIPRPGLGLILASVLLAVHFDLALEPFAVKVAGWWYYQKLPGVPQWYSAPVVNLLGWATVAVGAYVATFVWFIRKHPADPPPDRFPLAVWLVLQAWLAGGALAHHLWPAFASGMLGVVIVAGMVWSGARGPHDGRH